ncbi:triacylglycerol lipase [Ancylostoma caninum]|uniref:Triacylglycerol lipase n=1 Tax=Ancylostoma caninum TaxID=29170 RepID=A0A368FTZ6_ANCCA|nr:triacylglycerol lipase [Ancylostoma caninum]
MRDGWIIVAFRGTRTKIQLITELIESMSEPKRKLRAGGSVQHYFYVALEAVWKQMNATYPNYSIMFTGHSLGGALASLASTIYAHRNPILKDRIHLITFGQPRVGNFEYAETHNRLVPNSWRIVHKYDLVAHLPACAFQVFSRSCISLFNHSPYHHGTEVWFPSNMTENSMFRICEGTPLYEDNNCSNGYYLHYGVKDHIRYFEHEVSEYGINGCVDPPDSDGLFQLELIR